MAGHEAKEWETHMPKSNSGEDKEEVPDAVSQWVDALPKGIQIQINKNMEILAKLSYIYNFWIQAQVRFFGCKHNCNKN